ncbi:hypothetical protein [Psychrobacter sp. I-STPA6b]|uniref:hypothetical protein n=1 Tax=Psychrobacter sp. I-STPA6b TaxID=2585718 RepID=UPI001D0C8E22|nr:hypothetical protein [Psychrobacter sp. I-STPA6b]
MAIAIQHFTCTALAKQNLLSSDIDLTDNEKAVLEMVAHYDTSDNELKSEIEDLFAELYEHVNLTRLVALNLLKYHVDKPVRQSSYSIPLFDELFGLTDNHPVQNTNKAEMQSYSNKHSALNDSQSTSSDLSQGYTPSQPLPHQANNSVNSKDVNPALHVAMGLFDKS